ncbi:MAG TPA: hypothetical protein VLA19_19955, partial [Herpetosiphonaceae bacterium]|nr:hypothetical protein [Herpetosiphonaceae bacterium]
AGQGEAGAHSPAGSSDESGNAAGIPGTRASTEGKHILLSALPSGMLGVRECSVRPKNQRT